MSRRNLTSSHVNLHSTSQDNLYSLGDSSPEFGLNIPKVSNNNNNNNSNNRNSGNPFLGSDEEDYDITRNNLHSETSSFNNQDKSKGLLQDDSTRFNFEDSTAHNISDYRGYYSRNVSGINDSNINTDYDTVNNNNNNNINQVNNRILPQSYSTNNFSNGDISPNLNLSNNDIMSPPAFDRYPLVGSRVASSTNLIVPNSGNPNPHNDKFVYSNRSSPREGSGSTFSSSNNPFTAEHDFSPFGGYPATSFPLLMDDKEDDDYLHNPDLEEEARLDRQRFMNDFKHMDRKSFVGLIGILTLFAAGIVIFIVLPALTFTGVTDYGPDGEVINILTPYQYPQLSAIRTTLVDPDTPDDAKTRQARDGSDWKLVFSDEFNAEGRTFYDGDDQFWTGPDFHYDATKDLEWYTPDAATTANGTLKLRMDAYKNHGLYYRSGMLQSWNKLCFTQGILEVSANLPNYGRVTGLWPGLWTMGNLARPGYLASTEGLWPYSYESCDAGITPNQSSPDGISYLPGQRLSVCTCDGEDHPNQGVGRGAPEIDIIEGEVDTTIGVGIASQSLQIAPFDIWYIPDYDFVEVHNASITTMNSYCGGPFQQAVSAVTTLNTAWYEFGPQGGYYQKYSIEYLNDDDDGYITWFVGDNATWTLHATTLHPNGNIGWRRISKEPMSIILNLGISNNWAYIDWPSIFFPVTMSIDYVRIYQPSDAISITCDPEDYPTYDYINSHANAYHNSNLTSWEDAGYTFPKNILTGNCKSSKFSKS